MANTRQSAKRSRQEEKRSARNLNMESAAKTALRKAVTAIKNRDAAAGKDAYRYAVRALSSAASKGVIPKGRAARKISRLTQLALKVFPEATGNAAKKSTAVTK